jgi:signal transduction histidine kinase
MKSNFIAMAGHELRTPLTIITGFNDLIGSGTLGEIPDKVKETTRHIQDQLTDLNTQVQKILDMSSIEQGLLELNIEPADMTGLVTSAIAKRREVLVGRQLTLVTDIPVAPTVARIDAQRIDQAFLNLLDNAIRFTPEGGTITVRMKRTVDHIVVSVRDTGVGIHPKEIEWVFKKLYDVSDVLHHTSGQFRFGSRGFGLGLALTKALVEKHGGDIRVKSTLGQGSEFTIMLVSASEITSQEPEPVTTKQDPEPVTTKQDPAPVTKRQDPEPDTKKQDPAPVT